jgi:hypothetical protein
MQIYLCGGIFPDGIVTAEDRFNTCDFLRACAQRIFNQKCGYELEHLQRLQERTLQLRLLFSRYGETGICSLASTPNIPTLCCFCKLPRSSSTVV